MPETHIPLITHGNKNLHEIALTFDDGPFPNFTAKVLDVLEAYRIKATFFCIGRQVQAFPDLTLRAYKAGYEIENHSWSHPVMTGLSLEGQYWQLQHTNNTIERVTHQRPLVMRPPYGAYNDLHFSSQPASDWSRWPGMLMHTTGRAPARIQFCIMCSTM